MPPRDFGFRAKSLPVMKHCVSILIAPDETVRRVLKHDAQRCIYDDDLQDVSSGDETLCSLLHITFNDFKRRN